jgi:hypothetical protein
MLMGLSRVDLFQFKETRQEEKHFKVSLDSLLIVWLRGQGKSVCPDVVLIAIGLWPHGDGVSIAIHLNVRA